MEQYSRVKNTKFAPGELELFLQVKRSSSPTDNEIKKKSANHDTVGLGLVDMFTCGIQNGIYVNKMEVDFYNTVSDQDYLVLRAKNALKTDPVTAKAWMITAKTLYPTNFGVQVP